MTEVKRGCRICALWDIKAAQDKAGRIHKDRAARCKWVSVEIYPSSVSMILNRRPMTQFMRSTDGTNCPCWKPRE